MILAATVAATLASAAHAEEVVVTARRGPTTQLEIAGSISRLDSDALADLGARHQAEALNRIAGVEIQRGSGAESLTAIRSPVLTGPGACGSFLFLADGVPVRPTGFCNVNGLFELNYEQAGAIEVLRGPGPIAYGANAVHGIVNVISPDVATLPAAAAGVQVGADVFRRVTTVLGTQVGNTALGLYGVATHDGGFRAASGLDEAKLNLSLAQPLRGGTLSVRAAGTVLNQETAGFILGFDSYRDSALARSNPNPEAFRDAWSSRLTASYSREACPGCRDLGYATVRKSWMQFLQHFLIGKPLETNGQTSAAAGVSVSRPIGRHLTGTMAADFDWADVALEQYQPTPATDGTPAARAIRPVGLQYDYQVNEQTASGAVAVDWQTTDALRLSLGVRADRTRYDYDNRMRDGSTDQNGNACSPTGCLYSRPADRRDTFTNISPKLEAHWRWTPQTAVYALANRGFRPPEMTELYRLQRQQNIAELDSERLDAIEFGVKHEDENLAVRLAIYRMRKDHAILRDANGFNVSDGRTSHQGVEYELRWAATERVALSAAGSLARQRYEFSRAIEAGETITSGRDIDGAPRQLHSMSLDWRVRDNLRGAITAQHVGRYFLNAANTATYPGHTVVSGLVTWRWAPGWRMTLRGENLLDRAYADRADFAFGNYRYFPARGRSAFLSIDYVRR